MQGGFYQATGTGDASETRSVKSTLIAFFASRCPFAYVLLRPYARLTRGLSRRATAVGWQLGPAWDALYRNDDESLEGKLKEELQDV